MLTLVEAIFLEALRSTLVEEPPKGLDHWLVTNAGRGVRVAVAFFDFECRVLGRRSEALCPMADVMRYFRYGFPADDSVFALTVGVWPSVKGPLATPASVEAAVLAEARACGFDLQLLRRWDYRMITLLYRVSRPS